MTKDGLIKFIANRITSAKLELEDYGDRDELIENAADGGNHDDTFGVGEDYGYYNGQLEAFVKVLAILEDTPDAEHQTN